MHACAIEVLYFVVSINEIGNQIKLNQYQKIKGGKHSNKKKEKMK